MKQLAKKIIVVSLLLAPLFALPALAHEGHGKMAAETINTTQTESEREGMPLSERIKERVAGRLSEIKAKVCEKRLSVIKNIMAKAATQGAKHLDVFSKIAMRVEEFYTNKKLAIDNYDTLVAEVNAKKATAQEAIDAVKDADDDFSCDGDNPIGKADAFNGKVRAMHTALKDYRTAIKNLIVAVKQAANAAEGDE